MELKYRSGSRAVDLAVSERDGRTVISIDGRDIIVDSVVIDERSVTLEIAGKRHRVLIDSERGHVFAAHAGQAGEFVPAEDGAGDGGGAGAFESSITSPMPGKVLQILVNAGDIVDADTGLLLLEAMKMEMTVRATHRCRVVAVKVEADAMVGPGDTLVELEEIPEEEAE